jgi:hypothetical protein
MPPRRTVRLQSALHTYAIQQSEAPANRASRQASQSQDEPLGGDWKLNGDP